MKKLSTYAAEARKAITALVGVVAIAAPLVADGDVSTADKWAIGLAVITALGVYAIPNKPTTPPAP